MVQPVSLADLGERENERKMPDIFMRPEGKMKELDEVVVRASKVKFYYKGDTLVYNADAFILPEGSMLDALVAKLPGVELKGNGQIFVNGRYVESLLLDGKDFFKGKNQVALENLGTYMVKNIQVYERSGDMSRLTGTDIPNDKELVMDVKLKKDYMSGTFLNVEAGGGTASRYLGRLFGMWYTTNSRLSVYGNANNLSRQDKPAQYDAPSYLSSLEGLKSTAKGGIDYYVDNMKHTWSLSGNADISHIKGSNDKKVYTTNFLQGGDTYGYLFNDIYSRDLSVSTNHDFKTEGKGWNLRINPKFSYNHKKKQDSNTDATTDREIDGITAPSIRELLEGNAGLIKESLINRNLQDIEERYKGIDANIFIQNGYSLNNNGDAVNIWLESNYKDNSIDKDNLQRLLYGNGDSQSLRQRSHTVPDRHFMAKASSRYYYNTKNAGQFSLGLEYRCENTKGSSELFMARSFDNDNAIDDMPLLPDPANSYFSTLHHDKYQVKPSWSLTKSSGVNTYWFSVSGDLDIEHRKLFYDRGSLSANPSRTSFTVYATPFKFSWRNNGYKWLVDASYRLNSVLPDMIELVDYKDTSNPLAIQEGNPDLKDGIRHELDVTFGYYSQSFRNNLIANFNATHNDVTRGYRYNKSNGVYTYKSYNVDGNRSFTIYNSSNWMLGRNGVRPFTIGHVFNLGLDRSANMIGADSEPVKQFVDNFVFDQGIDFSYEFHGHSISANAGYTYRHSKFPDEGFSSFHFWDINYGLNGNFSLPLNFFLDTNITMFSRRGYTQSSMNDNRLIWNASLSYAILKGSLIFKLTANDMLNQAKKIEYAVNAQGRTQTVVQTLPRYVMLSVTYRLDLKPSKK